MSEIDGHIRELQDRIDQLDGELRSLQSQARPPIAPADSAPPPRARDGRRVLSRAGLLAGGAAAAAGAVGAAVAGSIGTSTAYAASDQNFVAQGGSGTAFSTASGSSYSDGVSVQASGVGVFAVSGDIGVFGNSTSDGNGVYGSSNGNAAGVFGYGSAYGGVEGQSVSGNGVYGHSGNVGVQGTSTATTKGLAIGVAGFCASSVGVLGTSTSGTGVFGSSDSGAGISGESNSKSGSSAGRKEMLRECRCSSNGGPGVQGIATVSPGVSGVSDSNAGVTGLSTSSVGVRGTSTTGRGGIFAGAAAAVKLTPSTKLHPTSGNAGDLFVDKNHALWFCTAGGNKATWKEVVLK